MLFSYFNLINLRSEFDSLRNYWCLLHSSLNYWRGNTNIFTENWVYICTLKDEWICKGKCCLHFDLNIKNSQILRRFKVCSLGTSKKVNKLVKFKLVWKACWEKIIDFYEISLIKDHPTSHENWMIHFGIEDILKEYQFMEYFSLDAATKYQNSSESDKICCGRE